ncbi:MAG TPA: DNA polymerase III subunit delta [Bacteroidia bacterium]|jgi:DNA polymerase-3 subunit delta'|nr:DNA polymerase III subunit delta [Bacteroidia bacterium]
MLFRTIIGQDEIKQRLIHSVKENRISHAQLFLGPEGSGSLALAFAYAQYIYCINKQEGDSCGVCPACLKCQKLVHPDLHLVFPVALSKDVEVSDDLLADFRAAFLADPYLTLQSWFDALGAENKQPVIAVKESASILRKLSLTTFEGGFKTMVIWLPEKMHTAAANKLLKILEEPPDKTLFLLVTENEDQLLRTIVSRTQLISIGKLSDPVMCEALERNRGLSSEEAVKLAFLADGSYSKALKMLGEHESAAMYLRLFQSWMRACLKFDAVKVIEIIEDITPLKREKHKEFLRYSLGILRECIVMNYADPSLVRLQGEELEFVKKFSRFIHAGNCERFIEELNKATASIERNAAPKMLFMDLSFRANELLNIPVPV